MSLAWSLAALPLLIGLNAFFVAAEYALVAIRPVQLDALRLRGRRSTVDAVSRLKANPAGSIGTIQVCITMTNLMLGWIGEPAMSAVLIALFGTLAALLPHGALSAISVTLSFLIVTLLTVVLSELLPKALTLRFAEPAAVLTAVPVLAIRRALAPLVWIMNAIANAITLPLGLGRVDEMEQAVPSLDELRVMTSQAAEHGVVTPRERSLVVNALALGHRTARQIMVPRLKVAYLDLQRSMEENRSVLSEQLFSRMPLCDGGLDHVIGVVRTKEFMTAYYAEGDPKVLSLIALPAVYAPESLPADALLALFHEQQTQLVFVTNEYGGVEGIVTLRDVVDELLADTPLKADASGSLRVPGDMPLHELSTVVTLPPEVLARHDVVTVGGLVVALLGRIPQGDETPEVSADGVMLRAVESDGRAVKLVEVQPRPAEPPETTPPSDQVL